MTVSMRTFSGFGWVVVCASAFYFLGWPVRVSPTLSTVSLTLAFAWSALPSFLRLVSPVRLPAASFMRPLPLSTCLSVIGLAPFAGDWFLDSKDCRAHRAFQRRRTRRVGLFVSARGIFTNGRGSISSGGCGDWGIAFGDTP